jgi:hypothetical protein
MPDIAPLGLRQELATFPYQSQRAAVGHWAATGEGIRRLPVTGFHLLASQIVANPIPFPRAGVIRELFASFKKPNLQGIGTKSSSQPHGKRS